MWTNRKVNFRVFFGNDGELADLLIHLGFEMLPKDFWDDENISQWLKETSTHKYDLRVKRNIFDPNGKLRAITADEFNTSSVSLIPYIIIPSYPAEDDFDDTDPFADR